MTVQKSNVKNDRKDVAQIQAFSYERARGIEKNKR